MNIQPTTTNESAKINSSSPPPASSSGVADISSIIDCEDEVYSNPLDEEIILLRRLLFLREENIDNIFSFCMCIWFALLLYFSYYNTLVLSELILMPCIGIFAAILANCIPVGGGIIYIPVLSLVGMNIKLGVAFSVATMSVGNGIFGFLNWLKRDRSFFIWKGFAYSVIPTWIGYLISEILDISPDEGFVRKSFAAVCFALASFVCVVLTYSESGSLTDALKVVVATTDVEEKEEINVPLKDWALFSLASLVTGFVFVPHIAIGPGLTTFFGLFCLGFKPQAAVVTGIVVGGWACWVPFAYHALVKADLPYELWVSVLPGVFLGAYAAPVVSESLGSRLVMQTFGAVLLATCFFYLFV
jgi:uncharacterized membrane protein YfcA